MSTRKLRIGVIFGGKSGEHEVSLQSARSVMDALDPLHYTTIPIGISKDGRWHVGKGAWKALEAKQPAALPSKSAESTPSSAKRFINSQIQGLSPVEAKRSPDWLPPALVNEVDVVFPVLHGTFGEDGTIQGLLEMAGVPYVGAGVLASALGMDKVAMKQLFSAVGIPQARWVGFTRASWSQDEGRIVREIEEQLGYPCFVKPANLGSSVGISKARNQRELIEAVRLALSYDRRVIVEEAIDAREIEIGVLGNDAPIASVAGEIVPKHEFYDYEAKYKDGGAELRIPADLSPEERKAVESYAIRAFQAIDCAGLARVDFFLERGTGRVLVNEINTMPGFTRFSMYPKLWEASGLAYDKLLDRLIELALERHAERSQLLRSYDKA
ncbi:D-alanine--D-alanine ligase [Alicyclobacillus mali]|uniref:D-alanine--D-alanine ligase n=1 Tax=Alicyclobacillus mali (ex Roth et al. 2021) TaxID=1123961 RepID=A0ABS0F2B7_9BACL|nr:D-alanine--D-alanine ligase [Alicyclobacillus mali (ex Roth et al. 2021)]MBF8377432.1 D-alanine--D-alanine ligase [Alicyclobacillus mali (ex Roth et al. 2021)]MCL6487400.1 D-alanine--D-alanine ligase [Alicyclobacillus mali (ex Roth et al. 2021)]